MARRYRKIEVPTWTDERFRRLSSPPPCGRYLWLYLLTGNRTTIIPGVVIGGELALAEELGWPVEGFREAFREAFAEGLVEADWKAGLVLLKKALLDSDGEPRETARPDSPNVLRSWAKVWPDIPESPLKLLLLQRLGSFAEGLGPSFAKAYQQAFAKALREASRHPSPNQDQDQEQDLPEHPAGARARDPGTPVAEPAARVALEGDEVVVRPPIRDQRAAILREVWAELVEAHARTRGTVAGGAGFGLGAVPTGKYQADLGRAFSDLRAAGHDYAGCRERLLWLVRVAETKALRDRNLRHFATCFEPRDAEHGLQVTDLAALAASRPSALAQGPAAAKRTAEARAGPARSQATGYAHPLPADAYGTGDEPI